MLLKCYLISGLKIKIATGVMSCCKVNENNNHGKSIILPIFFTSEAVRQVAGYKYPQGIEQKP